MKIAIVGSGGRLGAALVREFGLKYDLTGFNRSQLDLSNADDLRAKLHPIDFEVLINAAAFTNVDLCESHPEKAFAINAEAPGLLAKICCEKKAQLIHFSTDYVFDGNKREPYTEEDEARPISVYGESKLEGEKKVLALEDNHLIVRVSWVFGPDRPSFVDAVIKRARQEEHVDAIADKFATPTYTLDVAEMLPKFFPWNRLPADILEPIGKMPIPQMPMPRILHFANGGECSWQEYAQWALDCCREAGVPLKATKVAPLHLRDMKNFVAKRPVYSVLGTEKYRAGTGLAPRPWREAVADYIKRSYSKI